MAVTSTVNGLTLKGEDSVNAAAELPGQDVYGFYTAGTFANGTATKTRFPGKKYVGITPSVHELAGADVLDIETGDAVPSDAPAFVENAKPVNLNKPMIYADLAEMPEIISALNIAKIPRSAYYLWLAHWDGAPGIPAGYDGIQYQNTAGYDADTFNASIFKGPTPPPPAAETHVEIEYYKPGFGWVYLTDPGSIAMPLSPKIRVRASNGTWSNWTEITP